VGPRAGLDAEVRGKISYFCRESNPGHLVRSQNSILTELTGSPFYARTMYFFGIKNHTVGTTNIARTMRPFTHGQKAFPLQKANKTNAAAQIPIGVYRH
jgi:hypothetical protein